MKNLVKVLMLLLIAFVAFSCATTGAAPAAALPEGTYVVVESESGQLDDVWMVKDSPTASGGKYIVTEIAKIKPAQEEGTQANYTVTVDAAGEYLVYMKVRTFDEKNTSYYWSINGGPIIRCDHQYKLAWKWGFFNDDNPLRPEKWELNAGENKITVYHREQNVYLDKFVVSDIEGLTDAQLDSVK